MVRPFPKSTLMLARHGRVSFPSAMRQTRRERCSYYVSGIFILVLLTIQLFFWFFPPGPEGSLDDLIFWYAVYLVFLRS